MHWQIFLSGLSIGLISSFHCIGMCGPIAFSLPVHYLKPHQKALGVFLYNAGRISMYAFLGLIFGFIGRLIYLQGFARWFSMILGLVILAFLLYSAIQKSYIRVGFLDQANIKIQKFIAAYIQKKQLYGMFLIGAANGLLPCGMVYFAIAGALAAGSVVHGVLFMASFGLGTFPLMMLLSYFGFIINISVRNKIRKAVPYFMATIAILLILRGMNLGIPYISPSFNAAGESIPCHR
jgi:sulfite exporter TauE/SafE